MIRHGAAEGRSPAAAGEFARQDRYADGPEETQGIAIIGMACRFPDADTPEQFWENLVAGRESITAASASTAARAQANQDTDSAAWLRAGATLDGIDGFDAAFFGYSPREAALLDPQHRLFLEVCWEALEDGGAAGQRWTREVGVYAGSGTSMYLMHNLGGQTSRPRPNYLDTAQDLQLVMAADRDFLTSRVAYKLDLGGPSVNVQAACATSLYAVHLACQALLNGECDLALAGAAHVPVPQIDGYRPEPGLVLSQDGRCRAFDARATGTVFGSGVGAVLLKPLDQALADRDRVYAVVRGTAINNDGAGKPGFSAPSVSGQAAVIRQALAATDAPPGTISYVEAHGTATLTGDPIEVAALAEAFAGAPPQSCALGSVKTNIGHLGWAAGIAGLMKTALALRHRVLPPSLNFEEPNPAIDFAATPFFVQTATAPWPDRGGMRRAGVSAFGLGGTNAHVILEEAPETAGGAASTVGWDASERDAAVGGRTGLDDTPGIHVLPLSARTGPALREFAARIGRALLDDPAPAPADAAYSLGTGRRHFEHRAAVVGADRKTLAMLLDAVANGQDDASDELDGEIGLCVGETVPWAPPRLTALCTGQGAEYLEAGRDLYLAEPVFRDFVNRADPQYRKLTGRPLSEFLYRDAARRGMPIADLRLSQPAIFTLQAALLALWESWGVTPDTLIGHSVGEYAAAYGAGVLDFETGLFLVHERAKVLHSLPESGAMATVFAGEEAVRELLDGRADAGIAAFNAPNRTVISGEGAAVEAVVAAAARRGVKCKALNIGRAAHSAQLDRALDGFRAVLGDVELRRPDRAIVSTLTGAPVGEEIATADYWCRQLRQPVRFLDAVRAVGGGADGGAGEVFLEIGPSHTLSSLARMCWDADPQREPVWLETLRWERSDLASTRLALAGAYTAGLPVDWAAVSAGGRMVSLPTYPFQRRRCWIDAPALIGSGGADGQIDGEAGPGDSWDGAGTAAGRANRPPAEGTAQYELDWIDAPAPAEAAASTGWRCLLIAPAGGSAGDLVRELEQRGATVLVHEPAEHDDATGADADGDDAMVRALTGFHPDTVLNAVPVLRKRNADLGGRALIGESAVDDVLSAGGAVTLRTFQALSAANLADATIVTVTAGAHRVLTTDDVIPAQGAIIGMARTARTEFSTVRHVLIDLGAADTRQRWASAAARLAAVLARIPALEGDAELALRGDRTLLPRLRASRTASASARPRIDPTGWYLVTGGLSGVGLEFAHALLELGVRRLVLCGRSAPGPQQAEQVRRLRQRFEAEIRVASVDVASPQQVDRLFAEYCDAAHGGVRGVVHAAGVLDDGIIDRMGWPRIAGVLAPKAQGAWNLHRAAAAHAPGLDLFVLTASVSGLFGNPGQIGHAAANTYLDALAGHRRALGLAGLSLDLGSWAQVGVLAGNTEFLRRLEERGVGTISPADGRAAVRDAMDRRASGQIAVLPTRWHELDRDHHMASNPVLADLLDDTSAGSGTAAHSPARETDVLSCCRDVLARELGFEPAQLDGLDLSGAGMDSLKALTIRNRLQRRLGVALPASICLERSTLADLAADIEERARSQARKDGD